MSKQANVFAERAQISDTILRDFASHLSKADPKSACVYVTGSVARREASPDSDVDLFIVDTADRQRGEIALSSIDASLLKADLIRAGRKIQLPEFSGDGIYLDVHVLSDLIGRTGNRLDDYSNSFTARLLLMLESQPLLNKEAHRIARESVVASYWRDYKGNDSFFLPVFLANDIIRYWKTLCLNYESDRNSGAPSGYDAETWKRRNRLRNVKLKFSRLWTCHSATAYLLAKTSNSNSVSPNDALEMMEMSPMERFQALPALGGDEALVKSTLALYSWFLNNLPSGKEDAYEWVGNREQWQDARSHGQAFGDGVFDLLHSFHGESPLYRYLLG